MADPITADQQLARRIEMEELVLRISARFMEVEEGGLDAAINTTLEECAGFAHAQSAYLLTVAEGGETFSLTYFWWEPGSRQSAERVLDSPIQMPIGLLHPTLLRGEALVYDDVAASSDEHPLKQYLLSEGVTAMVGSPIMDGPEILGSAGLSRTDGPYKWTGDELTLLRFFGNTLAHTKRRLREQSARARIERRLAEAERMEVAGRLAGGIAHDFNNMLQVVLTGVELAHSRLGDQAAVEGHLEEMREAATRASHLTRQLLNFGRPVTTQRVTLNLDELLTELMGILRSSIPATVTVERQNANGLWAVLANRGQLEQVITNLCLNARDAMPNGGTLRIETQNVELNSRQCAAYYWLKPGPFVLLRVSDTGLGIAQHDLPHIFEPFYTTKSQGEGHGLGLASAWAIVRSHQGLIRARNSKDSPGATFRVYLPADREGATDAPPVESTADVPGGIERILVADDEQLVSMVISEHLRQAGYHVTAVRDGHEAVRAFEQAPDDYGVLVLDVMMPGMTGPEAARRCREIRPDIPLVFCSGYTGDHQLFTEDLPSTRLILKPFEAHQLLKAIRDLLDSD